MQYQQLRSGRCDNDAERTIARWLLQSNGDWYNCMKASGIEIERLQAWVQTLPHSPLKQFLPLT